MCEHVTLRYDPNVNKGHRLALVQAPITIDHVCCRVVFGLRPAYRNDACCFSHPPSLKQRDTETPQAVKQVLRRRCAASDDGHWTEAAGYRIIFLQAARKFLPDRWYPGRKCDLFLLHERQQALRVDLWAGQNKLGPGQCGRKGKAPAIAVKHGDNRKDRVVAAHAVTIDHGL